MTSHFVWRTGVGASILLSVLLLQPSALAADDDTKPVEITGWIVDEVCGRANANPNGKACTLKCQADGAKLVLYEEEEGEVYALSDQAKAEAHVGYVKVTGRIEGEGIEVVEIEDLDHRLRRRGDTGEP
jgi:hypothetical protein